MSVFNEVVKMVDRGREGLNKGLPHGFKRLTTHIPNIQQATFYLIGAQTKCGKTSFTDDAFLYNPFEYINSHDSDIILDIDYFSYEIEKRVKFIKGISRKIWKDYGLVVDINTILSRGENHCEQEIYDIVKSTATYFEKLEDVLTIHDIPENPTGISKYIEQKARSLGKVEFKEITLKDGTKIQKFDKYVPNNPNRYWILIFDHISLVPTQQGMTTKQAIDRISTDCVKWRNNYGLIPVIIQQLSFDTDNDDRHKSNRLTPTLRDFGDSKYTTRDANVILALFNPSMYDIPQFNGYNITKLGDTFRSLEILANRDGDPGVTIGLNFIGPCGTFRELPKANEMNDTIYSLASGYGNSNTKYIQKNGIWVQK